MWLLLCFDVLGVIFLFVFSMIMLVLCWVSVSVVDNFVKLLLMIIMFVCVGRLCMFSVSVGIELF